MQFQLFSEIGCLRWKCSGVIICLLSNVLSMLYDAGTRHQKPLKAFFPLETEKAAVQKLYFQLKI